MNPDMIGFGNFMQVIVVSTACFVAIGLGARILWRIGSRVKTTTQSNRIESDDRLHRLETAVDTIAIEVERISEAQRFMVGLLGESNQLKRSERGELPLPSRAERTNTPH